MKKRILERVRFELNHGRALSFCFDAFSSREPVSTSLENAPGMAFMAIAAPVDVGRLIEEQTFGRFQIGLLFWICAFMFIDGYDMQVVGYAAPAIIKAWHSDKAAFGTVFGAGLVGFMLGATLLGNLGDRFGRKIMIVTGALLFGAFTLACAFAQDLTSLLVLRAIAGIGLGGSIPNAIALMTEYAPSRVRATRVGIMFIGYSIGSALGGVIAAQFIPAYGWPSVFVIGGVLPIMLACALALTLPESARFLMLRRDRIDLMLPLLRRVRPDLDLPLGTPLVVQETKQDNMPVKQLFTGGRGPMTLLLWLGYAANMVSLHFLTSWLPTVVADSGVPLAHAVIATALLQAGGAVGSLVVGSLVDRIGPIGIVAAFLLAVPCVAGLGHVGTDETPLMLLVTIAGLCVIGGQVGINALAGTLYPTYMRSTGTGWAFGIGRLGSILGPMIGGHLIAFGLSLDVLFATAAVPIFVSATALFCIGRLPIVRNRTIDNKISDNKTSQLAVSSRGHRP
jgi:AAHS family 4-hydroxybenzoate transporter-like MFS transporter